MPATFPSHAAAVLPLKLWRPRRFDGVALVVGSTAPDLAYPFAAIVDYPTVHSLPGLFWWCLPVGLLLTWLIRRATPIVAAHLPDGGPLALRDYGVLGQVRHRWHVTLGSVLVGSATHLLWDGFTHSPETNGWAVARLPWLTNEAIAGVPWFRLFQHGSSLLGAAVAIALFVHIGRHRLVRRWHGEARPAPRSPALFWSVAAAVVLAYPLSWPWLTHLYQPHVQGVRLLCFSGLGLLAGAAAVRLRRAIRLRRASVRGRMNP
ncbi:MAG TPA: DUF4184 family protein [Pilimelia sp.]|nr:DUF4184 family protein [Pilimelia sp.]